MRGLLKYLGQGLLGLVSLGMVCVLLGAVAVGGVLAYYAVGLPDHETLKDYDPPVVSRVYAADGRLMGEFASEKRIFIPIEFVPERVKNAFLSAEDQNFYHHQGVDLEAIIRAMRNNILRRGGGLQGGSTITQQVAKNFLLTNERKLERKIREAILSRRIEGAMSKDKILELYLNDIYLGRRSYGVGAAALVYFDKSLEELTLAEAAFLAALPKAPARYDPDRRPEAAKARRDWVLGRMVIDGYESAEDVAAAQAQPLETAARDTTDMVDAPYFVEEVRRELYARYGEDGLYAGGLAARATVDPALQEAATEALRQGLMEYDQRHGYRGPVARLDLDEWDAQPGEVLRQAGMLPSWRLALVRDVSAKTADLEFLDDAQGTGTLPFKQARWARESLDGEGYRLGRNPTAMTQIVAPGDVIMVELVEGEDDTYALRQVPQVQGAIIALDPHTGRVLAMQGGWMQGGSEYNRATQARRQPGSAFKPFVYLAALEAGFTPATLILDAPFVIEDRPGSIWAPKNYDGTYAGPTPLRRGLEKSKNLMTVRLAAYLGMERIVEVAQRFAVADDMEPLLSASLGSVETTLLRLTAAYGVFANGGEQITPTFIDRIQDRRGRTIYRHDARECLRCGPLVEWSGQVTPRLPDGRAQIVEPVPAYQMVSLLQGVVQRGTGARLARMGRPMAGKTGTTNESRDAWFIGFTPDLVAGVYIGFDAPRSLGRRETGASAALPVFEAFMTAALDGAPATPFRAPRGVRRVRINAETGARAQPGDARVIWEVFAPGTEPGSDLVLLDEDGVVTTVESLDLLDPLLAAPEEGAAQGQTYAPVHRPPPPEESGGGAISTGTGGIY